MKTSVNKYNESENNFEASNLQKKSIVETFVGKTYLKPKKCYVIHKTSSKAFRWDLSLKNLTW